MVSSTYCHAIRGGQGGVIVLSRMCHGNLIMNQHPEALQARQWIKKNVYDPMSGCSQREYREEQDRCKAYKGMVMEESIGPVIKGFQESFSNGKRYRKYVHQIRSRSKINRRMIVLSRMYGKHFIVNNHQDAQDARKWLEENVSKENSGCSEKDFLEERKLRARHLERGRAIEYESKGAIGGT